MRIVSMNAINKLSILAAAIIAFAACENEKTPPQEEEKQTAFSFEHDSVTHTSVATDIIPEDKDMDYIVFLSEVKHFYMNGIDTEQELFEDDYLYFSEMAEAYEMPMTNFLSSVGWLAKGDKRGYKGINLYPDTEYVIYCYGVELDGQYYTPITDIEYVLLRTSAPELQSTTFGVETSVDGNVATFKIQPEEYDGYYYHYIVPKSDNYFIHEGMEADEQFISYYRNKAMEEFNEMINTEGKSKDSFCHKGATELVERLEPNTDYMLLLFTVSDDQLPLLNSVPEPHYFATGDAQLSEFAIELTVSDITPYDAQLSITPSSDEPYACVFLTAKQFPESEDEMETMNKIIEYYIPAIFNGPHSEKLTPLMPNSEYVVAAFGCDGKKPTGHLYVKRFTTPAQNDSKVYIEDIKVLHIFDVAEVAAIDARYEPLTEECECLVVVEAVTNTPCDKVYYFWFEEWMRHEYSEEAFFEDLMMYEPTPSPTVITLWYSPDEFFFAGVAEDEEGNMSDIYYGEAVPILKSNRSAAEEFFTLGIDLYKPELRQ
ncbi:MAG: hypothetical protein IKC57_04805 [Alistipes sp.]|nr:hypothetical protein [Alistipes sp.]